MKPYHYSALDDSNNPNMAFCFRSDSWWPGDASTYLATGKLSEMSEMAQGLNAEIIVRDYKGKQFTRYITNWYVTIDHGEALSLCKIDQTDPEKIKITDNVELFHNSGFALWSDGKITNTVSQAPTFSGIAECANKLINGLRGSDSGGANLPGGMFRLTQIVKIGEENIIARESSRGVYNTAKIKKFDVVFSDGTTQTLFSTEEGYFEGYAYDIYINPMDAFLHGVTGENGISDFSGYRYDSQLGYMKDEE